MKKIVKDSEWHNTQFITHSLKHYLESKGFRLNKPDEEQLNQSDKIIVATRLLSKEIIEIRGTVEDSIQLPPEEQAGKKGSLFMDAIKLISETLLLPIGFLSPQNIDQESHCVCLPDIGQYRRLIEKVEEYFISNCMHLKVYFVKQNGSVRITYLNPTKRKKKQARREDQRQ